MILFTGIALATSSASSDIVIYTFDQNPAGRDEDNEWVTLYNPSNESVDIGNWVLETTDGERETIPEGTTLYPFAYYVYSPPYQWLDNSEEAITLRDTKGEVVDRTPVVRDNENDNRYWMRNDSEWIFGVKELEKGEIWSGCVKNVVDGDTVDVSVIITSGGTFYGMADTTADGCLIPVSDNTDFNVPTTAKVGPYNVTSREGTVADIIVDEPEITGDVFIEGTTGSVVGMSIPVGTRLQIRVEPNFGGLMKNATDGSWSKVKIKLDEPGGGEYEYVKILNATAQEMNVGPTAGMNDVVWDRLNTIDWHTWTWKVKITTDKGTCNEVDVSSPEYEFTVRSEELTIEAEEDEVSRGEDIVLTVTGNPITYYYLIVTNVDVTAPPAIEDTNDVKALDTAGDAYPATGTPNLAAWIKTGSDGIADVKVDTSGADERTYTIKVYYEPENATGPLTPITDFVPDEEIVMCEDDDDIDVVITKAKVTFDMPIKVVIGEDVTIKGTISAGDYVDIVIESAPIVFDNEPVDENNEFEVKWDTAGLTIGTYTIDVYIDCDVSSDDPTDYEGIDEDGKISIRLVELVSQQFKP